MRVREGSEIGLEGWLRWSAHPIDGVKCRRHSQYIAFVLRSSKVAVGFFIYLFFFFLHFVLHNLPQLPTQLFLVQTRDLFKKIRDTKGTFHAKMASIKDRNGMDLTEAEDIKSGDKNTWKNYTKKRSSQPR